MILFVGQTARRFRERGAFQEVDCRRLFGAMTKWTTEIDLATRLPETVMRAFYTATGGRPGPVVIGLPSDMLDEAVPEAEAPTWEPVETAPSDADMARLAQLVAAADRPIFILGGSRWNEDARRNVQRFAERFDMPMITSYRRLPLFDPLHRCYAGDLGIGPNPKLVARIKAADLVVLCGGRLGEIPSQGFTLLDIPAPRARLVHVHADVGEFGKLYRPDLAIHASPIPFAAALAALKPPQTVAWRDETGAAHADYLAWTDVATDQPGAVNLGMLLVWLRDNVPDDTILCNGAGNYAAWIHRFYRFRRLGAHIATTSASMGYGVPAAVAMKRLYPDRTVLSVNGDGDFLMNGQEFATAVQYDLPIVTIVCDNGMYGTIRMHQERAFPGRGFGTDLRNPDFAAYARAFGGFGVSVDRTEAFPDAFGAALAAKAPAIIHVKLDPEAVTPATTLGAIREAALTRQQMS